MPQYIYKISQNEKITYVTNVKKKVKKVFNVQPINSFCSECKRNNIYKPSESCNDAPAVQKNKYNALFCFVIDIVHREEE